MFRRALAALIASPVTPPTAVSSARQQLREALALRRPAEEALQEAIEATTRVRKVIAGVRPAASEAENAARAAVDTTRQWALTGARSDLPSGDQSALDRAADAQRKAHQAKLRAEGAADALPDVIEAEDQARRNFNSADDAIKGARAQVLMTEARPLIEELEQMQSRYSQLLCEVAGLSLLLDPRYVGGHPWRAHVSSKGGRELKEQLSALAIPLPSERDSELRRSVNLWEDFAKRLATDPDATLSK